MQHLEYWKKWAEKEGVTLIYPAPEGFLPPPPGEPFDFARMIACADREVAMRKRVYKYRVEAKQMRSETAEYEIAGMEMIARYLRTQDAP